MVYLKLVTIIVTW